MMSNSISQEELFQWCTIPMEDLADYQGRKIQLEIYKDRPAAMFKIGNLMADEVASNNAQGLPTKWVLPAGPTDEYDIFIEQVNRERISLKKLFVFHMDDFLDWQGRPYPVSDTYESLEGTMNAVFYGRIDPNLNVPVSQRFWPRINDLDYVDDKVVELGGIDTVWAGVGAKGLVAFCEAPRSYTHRLTIEEFANSKTRIVDLADDTIVALSQRTFGACYDRVPPRAVTLGFKTMLNAKRAILMITTGSWKQTVVRVALFSEPTLEYPVTLLAKYIPEVILICDENTADHPMSHPIKGW